MIVKNKIILIGGKTGGPIIPLLAIAKNLENSEFIIYGVKGGFEDKISKDKNIPIKYFQVSKLNILTFKNNSVGEIIFLTFDTIVNLIRLFLNVILAIIELLKTKPRMILSAGGFVGVPVIFSAFLLNKIKVLNCLIIVHQQDPVVGLTNKIVERFSDLKTCVFEYSKKYSSFKDAKIIPNPIDGSLFEKNYLGKLEIDEKLKAFLNRNGKKLLLIMGGGGGSYFINNWVGQNLDELTDDFRVIHLTGLLIENENSSKNSDYLAIKIATTTMPLLLVEADIVICRAGLSSITELSYLNKQAFLVPIPESHQIINAEVVKDQFEILEQDSSSKWLEKIKEKIKIPKSPNSHSNLDKKLEEYYQTLNDYLS